MDEERLTNKQKREEKRKKQQEIKGSGSGKTLAIVVVVFLVLFGLYKAYQWVMTPTELPSDVVEIAMSDHIKGDREAEVVLVEYGDYQCPACAQYVEEIEKLYEEFSDEMVLVYRHFPLISIHKNAVASSKAAVSAGLQGKFWEMHEKLYSTQLEWENESGVEKIFIGYAEELGLNIEQFVKDYESDAVEEKVNGDLLSANRLGLNSTPSFILNGKKIKNPRNFDEFKAVILKEIEAN